ncbi:MAG: family 10 glycosylhydrolase, partial [Gemmatimonadaceae bacterium]|nr:family 10 glycosylhydrolase [Gemmatimonadaceae bacterium]
DARSWKKYLATGGTLSRDDWRRENVNTLVRQLNEQIHATKPWVKFGISPFGIWRPGYPEQVKGFDAYEQLYADSKLWWEKNWVDYFTPQLYWQISRPEQPFATLMRWWGAQNTTPRHLWIGLFTSRARAATEAGNGLQSSNAWSTEEILAQVDSIRAYSRASGEAHFSMKAFLNDQGNVGTRLLEGAYAEPALVPASPWLSKKPLSTPKVRVVKHAKTGGLSVAASLSKSEVARWYLVQTRTGGVWHSRLVVPSTHTEEIAPDSAGLLPDRLVVTALDRAGVASPAVLLRILP